MTSTERAAISKAWKARKEAALLAGEAALLYARIVVSQSGEAALLSWNSQTREFDETPLRTGNLAGVQQRALYAKQEELEAEGGNVVATSLVLIRTPSGQPALLHWTGTEWARITTQELMK